MATPKEVLSADSTNPKADSNGESNANSNTNPNSESNVVTLTLENKQKKDSKEPKEPKDPKAPTSLEATLDLQNPRKIKRITQFPSYIKDNPCFEKDAVPGTSAALKREYIEGQKRDYLKALEYAEKEILTLPIQDWTVEKVNDFLANLYRICSHTLLTHSCSPNRVDKIKAFRETEIFTLKECPTKIPAMFTLGFEDLDYRYNLDNPIDTFGVLTYAYSVDLATNFMKWYIKWLPRDMNDVFELGLEMEKRFVSLELFHKTTRQAWREKHFGGKRFDEWVIALRRRNAIYAPPTVEIDEAWTHKRAIDKSLYTQEEIAARDKVCQYYPTAKELPAMRNTMVRNLLQMVKTGKDPIDTATVFHDQLVNGIHLFVNGNHRIARMMMNIVLMNYGLPPHESDEKIRAEYMRAADAGAKPLALFIRKQTVNRQANLLCVAARDGKVEDILDLLSMGVDVNRPASKETLWTPLHYACKKENIEAIKLLIMHGGNVYLENNKKKSAFSLLPEGEKGDKYRSDILALIESLKSDAALNKTVASSQDNAQDNKAQDDALPTVLFSFVTANDTGRSTIFARPSAKARMGGKR